VVKPWLSFQATRMLLPRKAMLSSDWHEEAERSPVGSFTRTLVGTAAVDRGPMTPEGAA
jgi:hypothetical protein